MCVHVCGVRVFMYVCMSVGNTQQTKSRFNQTDRKWEIHTQGDKKHTRLDTYAYTHNHKRNTLLRFKHARAHTHKEKEMLQHTNVTESTYIDRQFARLHIEVKLPLPVMKLLDKSLHISISHIPNILQSTNQHHFSRSLASLSASASLPPSMFLPLKQLTKALVLLDCRSVEAGIP